MRSTVFWIVTPFSSEKVTSFEGIYCLHLQGIKYPSGGKRFLLLHSVQTGSGTHPAYYPMGTVGSFPNGKAAEV
jgi:hypothetical protein